MIPADQQMFSHQTILTNNQVIKPYPLQQFQQGETTYIKDSLRIIHLPVNTVIFAFITFWVIGNFGWWMIPSYLFGWAYCMSLSNKMNYLVKLGVRGDFQKFLFAMAFIPIINLMIIPFAMEEHRRLLLLHASVEGIEFHFNSTSIKILNVAILWIFIWWLNFTFFTLSSTDYNAYEYAYYYPNFVFGFITLGIFVFIVAFVLIIRHIITKQIFTRLVHSKENNTFKGLLQGWKMLIVYCLCIFPISLLFGDEILLVFVLVALLAVSCYPFISTKNLLKAVEYGNFGQRLILIIMIASVSMDIIFIENLWVSCGDYYTPYGSDNERCSWYLLNGVDEYFITNIVIGFGVLFFTWILFIVNHNNFYTEIKKLKNHQDLTRPNLFQSNQVITTQGQPIAQQYQYTQQDYGSVSYPSYVNQTQSVASTPSTAYQQQTATNFQTGQPSRSLVASAQQDMNDAYSLLQSEGAISSTSNYSAANTAQYANTQTNSGSKIGANADPNLVVYTRHELIAQGGMADVYRATHTTTRQVVAWKESHNRFNPFSVSNQKMLGECELLTQLAHERLPKYITHGYSNSPEGAQTTVLIQEFIPGGSLQETVEQCKKMNATIPLERIIELLDQSCEPLIYMASLPEPIYHRDLKPHNIIVHPERGPIVIDFGLAKIVATGSDISVTRGGSGTWTAPERDSGVSGPFTDVYSLGKCLYYLMTYKVPPTIITEMEKNEMISLGSPVWLADLMIRSAWPRNEQRIQTVSEFQQILRNQGGQIQTNQSSASSDYTTWQ